MTRRKTDPFTELQGRMAEMARALGHPARIAIVTRLLEVPELCCGAIVEMIPLAQATVSQHLKALVEVGLLAQREEGPKVFYSLKQERIQCFCQVFRQTLQPDADLDCEASASELE